MEEVTTGTEVPGALGETPEQTITLPLAKFRERLERAKRQVRREYGDLGPDVVREMRLETEAFAAQRAAWESTREEMAAQARELGQTLERAQADTVRERTRNELVRQFIAQGGLPAAIDDALSAMESGAAIGNEFDAARYVKEFLSGRPYFRRLPGSAGSGAPAGRLASAAQETARLDSREGRLAAARRQLRT